MGRIGEADDVAGLALLLTSPAGSFVNGKVIGADGGASERQQVGPPPVSAITSPSVEKPKALTNK
jgi:hypothetical protein